MISDKSYWQGWPHVLSGKQFERDWLESGLFPLALTMDDIAEGRQGRSLSGKRVRLLFYEASERTLDSFITACDLLYARSVSLPDPEHFSSQAKGESFSDMIRVINCYEYDAIVIRSKEQGKVAQAASVSKKAAVINAGDGPGEHPTQALLDVFTIHRELGQVDGASIALVGDLVNSRTTRSLAYMLVQWKVGKIYFVGPPLWRIGDDITGYLGHHGVDYEESYDLEEVAPELDIIYLTRAQTERSGLVTRYKKSSEQKVCIALTEKVLEVSPDHTRIMHPMPRSETFNELPEEFTEHPKVIIFDQVRNGLLVRMALLEILLG